MKDLEFTDNHRAELIYDILAGVLAIIAVLVVMLQFSSGLSEGEAKAIGIVDSIIYIIFVLDYFIRLITCIDRRKFFKNNIIDLVAILPFGVFTKSTFGSVFKLLRVLVYVLRLVGNIKEILFTNGFLYALGSTVVITILGSVGIYIFEKGVSESIGSYGDALWWSFVTVTTVGYGDISPTTTGGRFIACILMLAGIGFLSMLTSTISTFFFTAIQNKKNEDSELEQDRSGDCTIDLSVLSEEDKNSLKSYYRYLISKNNNN